MLSALVTVVFAVSSSLRFGYRAPALHVSLETTASLVALLAAFLVFGRLRRQALLGDVFLACGLGVLALSNAAFRAVPAVGNDQNGFIVWAALAGRLVGALFLAVSPFVRERRLIDGARTVRSALVGCAVFVVAAGAAAWLLHGELPVAVRAPSGAAAEASHPQLSGDKTVLAVQLIAGVFYAVAAIGFIRRYERQGDEFARWLALGSTLSVFSRVNYFLYPSVYTEWVYLGDVFRLGFFLLLLVGALREIASYWRAAVISAAAGERQRLARGLHDGLAQEVALMHAQLTALNERMPGDPLVERLRRGAERAYDEARKAVSVLSVPVDRPLEVLLADALKDVAERQQVRLRLELGRGVRVDAERAEAVVGVAAEAVRNAGRHSGAGSVRVRLWSEGGRVRLRVSDRGNGFVVAEADGGDGFGLVSMRGRAAAVGGELTLESRPGGGTVVELVV